MTRSRCLAESRASLAQFEQAEAQGISTETGLRSQLHAGTCFRATKKLHQLRKETSLRNTWQAFLGAVEPRTPPQQSQRRSFGFVRPKQESTQRNVYVSLTSVLFVRVSAFLHRRTQHQTQSARSNLRLCAALLMTKTLGFRLLKQVGMGTTVHSHQT